MIALRLARLEDLPAIEALIARSAQELSARYYTPAQVAALRRYVFGADTQLTVTAPISSARRTAARSWRRAAGAGVPLCTARTG